MKRTTIMLPPKLRSKALRRAHKMSVSLGKLIRESLTTYLEQVAKQDLKDPLFEDEEIYSGPSPKDLSERHDDYLYGE